MSAIVMTYSNIQEIDQLVQLFQSCQLPRSQWTHPAHLTVALWFLSHYPQVESIARIRVGIRVGIRRYNQAVEIHNTATSGYHETITQFWIRRIQLFLHQQSSTLFTLEQCNELIQQCCDPKLPLQYYSHDYLMSWQARSTWVEPDLRPLF